MILKARLSEKAYQRSLAGNTYVFVVPKTATKLSVKAAVEAQFGVGVTNVAIMVQNGKTARSIRLGNRRARPISGVRSDVKKAYVSLKDGDRIKIFDEEEKK